MVSLILVTAESESEFCFMYHRLRRIKDSEMFLTLLSQNSLPFCSGIGSHEICKFFQEYVDI
jgi:hypothetical protein